jgi:hypothetical protein
MPHHNFRDVLQISVNFKRQFLSADATVVPYSSVDIARSNELTILLTEFNIKF